MTHLHTRLPCPCTRSPAVVAREGVTGGVGGALSDDVKASLVFK
jgi:hypothetical protein